MFASGASKVVGTEVGEVDFNCDYGYGERLVERERCSSFVRWVGIERYGRSGYDGVDINGGLKE